MPPCDRAAQPLLNLSTRGLSAMTQNELNQKIAQATGETLSEISRLGFQAGMLEMEDFEDGDDLEPSFVDWDVLEVHRNIAFFEQREPLITV